MPGHREPGVPGFTADQSQRHKLSVRTIERRWQLSKPRASPSSRHDRSYTSIAFAGSVSQDPSLTAVRARSIGVANTMLAAETSSKKISSKPIRLLNLYFSTRDSESARKRVYPRERQTTSKFASLNTTDKTSLRGGQISAQDALGAGLKGISEAMKNRWFRSGDVDSRNLEPTTGLEPVTCRLQVP